MAIEFTKKPIDWDNAGITPPQDLIERGFQPGYKPPAEYFNALLHTTSEAIKELQEKAVELSNTVDEGGGASEHTDSVTPHITDAACTYSNSVYTLTPNKEIGNANYFCLRFKAPNDYVTSASFKIGAKTYTAVNAAFEQNDIVILNFDVSQSKCFFVSGSGGKSEEAETHIIDAVCSWSSSDMSFILTPNKEIGNTNYFFLRFKAPTDCMYHSFKIGTKSYTAENVNFIKDDIVILNFDVSQSKCFSTMGCGRSFAGKQGYTIDDELKTASAGAEIFNCYTENTALGAYSTAMGYRTTASGNYSIAMGMATATSGESSFAMGCQANASGNYSIAMGFNATATYSHSVAIGCNAKADGIYSTAMGFYTTANSVNTAMGRYNKIPTGTGTDNSTGDLFVIGNGSISSRSNAFRVTAAGDVMGTKSYSASGADYAEMFEWADGNPDNEDRRGLFVTLDGEKIRPADENDDYILGVVSATPSVVADAQTDDWGRKWKTDVFGEKLLDEKGAWILNENFREEDNESYVSRLDRKEWAAVGLVGKLIVVDDGTCEVNGYCVTANGGIATKSETGYRVLSRLDENHIKILVK